MNTFAQYWWHEYRRERYRPRTRLGHEMLCRKTLCESMIDLTKNCSLSGVNKISDSGLDYKVRVFWLGIFCTIVVTLVYCLLYVWSGLSKPMIVSMDSTTYGIANIDFPGVALCNINRVSESGSKNVAKIILEELESNYKNTDDRKVYYTFKDFHWLIKQTGRFLDSEFSESFQEKLSLFDQRDITDFDSTRITEFMRLISPNCAQMLMKCAWNGQIVPCDELFQVRRTIRGHCCTFNYVLKYNGSDGAKSGEIKRQRTHGPLSGLNVIMDPQIEDYAYPLFPMYGIEVLLFDPKHFPDFSSGRVVHRFVEINTGTILQLQSRKQIATNEVRKYSTKTRNCIFHDELKEYGDMYSMSSCIAKCRVEAYQDLCKCTPYFLPTSKGPVCSIDAIQCLDKYKEKLLYLFPQNPETWVGLEREYSDSTFCPECLPDCEHTQHYTKENKIQLKMDDPNANLDRFYRDLFFHSVNLTNKCMLSLYQATSDGTLDRLDVVLYWYELLSNVGGFGGLLLGFSLVAVVELFYFLYIRFVVVLHENYAKFY